MNAARHFRAPVLCAALLATMGIASAQSAAPRQAASPATQALPSWDRLTPAQRDLLLAPLRERWDANPDDRARMYEHAAQWRQMTPEQRARARRGLRHWERMDPGHRREMRALFEKMRTMTPDQRRAWVEANPPKSP